MFQYRESNSGRLPTTTHESFTNNRQHNSILFWYQSTSMITSNAGTKHTFHAVRVCDDSFSAGQDTPQFHKITRSTTLITNVSHWPYPEQVQITPLSQWQPGFDPKPVRAWDMWWTKSQRDRVFPPSISVRSTTVAPPPLHTHVSFTYRPHIVVQYNTTNRHVTTVTTLTELPQILKERELD